MMVLRLLRHGHGGDGALELGSRGAFGDLFLNPAAIGERPLRGRGASHTTVVAWGSVARR